MPPAVKGEGIKTPHDHDVLSGRGNFVNYHPGNEHFRSLVRKHKLVYVKCPKPQKGKFSKLIYEEIKARNPPGRFLKQDASSKLWYDIGEKKALDKTRQALREGAPELMKELSGDSGEDSDDEPVIARKKVRENVCLTIRYFWFCNYASLVKSKMISLKSCVHYSQTLILTRLLYVLDKNGNLNTSGLATMGSMFPGDNMQNPFMGGFSSPGVLSRNGMMSIGSIGMSPMASPGLLSPGMMMTPDLQLSTRQMQSETGIAGRFHSPLSDTIPPPQVHVAPNDVESMNTMLSSQQQQQFFQQQQRQLEQMQHQMTQQQQQFLMNSCTMNNNVSNFDGISNFDMMSPQQRLQQMRISQMRQQVMNNQIQQQQQLQQKQQLQQQQPQQMHMNQLRQQHYNQPKQQDQQFQQNRATQSASEMQMLQNKLAAIYSAEAFDPRPIADQTVSSDASSSNNNMSQHNLGNAKEKYRGNDVSNMDNTIHADNTARGNSRVEIPPGINPRRMPPPSLLKRDDSLKMDKIFEPASPAGDETKKKYGEGHGSSAHLSAMSLSMGDLNDEGNFSHVFDSSLKLSGGNSQKNNSSNTKIKPGVSSTSNSLPLRTPQNSKAFTNGVWGGVETKIGDRSVNNHAWDHANLDMSVATLGASEIGASEVGNMSYATLNMPDHDGHMSFSRVFEEAEK
jgi:hypothetical protein